jgi:hypothetical protein
LWIFVSDIKSNIYLVDISIQRLCPPNTRLLRSTALK